MRLLGSSFRIRAAANANVHIYVHEGNVTQSPQIQGGLVCVFSSPAGAGIKRVKDGRNARTRDLGSLVPIPTLRLTATVISRAC